MWYFEFKRDFQRTQFAPRIVKAGIYSSSTSLIGIRDKYYAERIWVEKDGEVVYLKNRMAPAAVDMKEFIWIKLKAKELR